MRKKWRLILFISIIILLLIGIIMVFSSSSIWAKYKFGDSFKYVKNQFLFSLIGIFLIVIINKLNPNFFYNKAKPILIFSIILMILVLIPGIGIIRNGSRSWFGISNFSIQPSELCKIALILYTAKYLSNKKPEKHFKSILIPLSYLIIIFFLIMLQPDLGTGIIIVISIIAIFFISNLNKKFFYITFLIGIFGIVGLIIIAPYRMARIISFINPWNDPLGSGFQIIQSLYAIGPGGILGFGLFNSRQKYFYLPEPQTDFIFSIICEELGFIGAFVVIILFYLLLKSGISLALQTDDLFKKYAIFGLVFEIVFQAVLNLSVVVGLIPVTGVTLPFISYGGSSLLVSMISIGIILNLSKTK